MANVADLAGSEPRPLPPAQWTRLDALVDRAPTIVDLLWHGLETFGARRRRALGLPVEAELLEGERNAVVASLSAPIMLGQIRAALDGPLLLLKGCEVAARYPDPALRPFTDLDLLVADSGAAQRALLAAGLEEVRHPDMFVGAHHERTLSFGDYPLLIELHHAPKWPVRLPAPGAAELFELAVPAAVGIEGLTTLPPAHHAVLLAAHSWAHVPLRRIRDFVDIAVMSEGIDRGELREIARGWGLERIWRTTIAVVDSLLAGGEPSGAQRLWARNLDGAREQTVFEMHVAKVTSPFWALEPAAATRLSLAALGDAATPADGERWSQKVQRMLLALRHGFASRTHHERQLEASDFLHRKRRRVR